MIERKCPVCNEPRQAVVDTETDVKGRTFQLIECPKCKRTVIEPVEKAKA